MDFFKYALYALQSVDTQQLWVSLLVGGICFALVFIFQGIGLYVIAAREGIRHKWMAFVPFANTYFIGVLAKKNRVFGKVDTQKFALAAALLECVLFGGFLLYYIAQFKLINAGCVFEVIEDGHYGPVSHFVLKHVPPELGWAAWCYEMLYDYILSWLYLIFLFLQIMVLSAFFQTYAARRYFLFTLVSVLFPIQGIFIFAVRKNLGMGYRDYMRVQQERQYRMYQQYYQQNGGFDPYNSQPPRQNNYNDPYQNNNFNNQNGNVQSAPDDPFSGFGNGKNSDDPFN